MQTTRNGLITSNGTTFDFNTGATALMMAAARGHANLISLLKKEIGMQDNKGWTALMYAAREGHANCIRLLERELGMQDNFGWTALMWAAWNGEIDCAKLLLSEVGKQSTKDWNVFPPGTTALMLAAYQNRPQIVELLLPYEQGLKDSKGNTAKWHANNSPRGGDFTKVRKLLENEGSNRLPPQQNNDGMRKFQEHNDELATKNKLLEKELASQKVRNISLDEENARLRTGSLISAAIQGDIVAIRKHLDQAGQQDPSGMTALMHAASKGHTEAVRLLRPLEARLQDASGMTALMHAVRTSHKECVDLLLMERDIKDGEGRTAAEHAVGEEMRRVLLHQPVFPKLPNSLSTYQLTAVLGRGSFGTVYTANRNGKNLAVKVVDLGEHSEELREKLRDEAQKLLALNHPNIIRCLGVGENDLANTYMFVMELCCGDLCREMRRRRDARSSYSDQEVWRIIRDVAAALAYLHERRIAHRNLKPANVFLTPSSRCVLGDFGLAKALGDSSQMDTFVGTMPYMAPEIHRGESYDKSVDVWALGVMAYELCTQNLPFGNIIAIIGETPAPRIEGRSSELAELISRMLSKDPRDRPTAREVLEEAEKHQPPLDG